MPATQFQPSKHGFHFSNNDLKLSKHGGFPLCGGMAYAAIDYFVNGMTIPHDIEAPLDGTPLNNYLFGRQAVAHLEYVEQVRQCVHPDSSNLERAQQLLPNPGARARNAGQEAKYR